MATGVARQRAEQEAIAADPVLQSDLSILPSNYNWEVPKCVWKIRTTGAKVVGLQLPEGLLMYGCLLADLLEKHSGGAEIILLGDVTYGACCVDDLSAAALGCELLIHYGHSCLVPIQDTNALPLLYVFVSVHINLSHLVDTLGAHFEKDKRLALLSTVQFVASLHAAQKALQEAGFTNVRIPQCSPLSKGEVLGCTSPVLEKRETDAFVYVGDGRFHLESIMMQNPEVAAFQYDPYARKFTKEEFQFDRLLKLREGAINAAVMCQHFGLIQGTLGRQGNPRVVQELERQLIAAGRTFVRVLLSEISPAKLAAFEDVDCWVQVACPRLSTDWGHLYARPLLSPYELAVALRSAPPPSSHYPQDFYAEQSLGPWTNRHPQHRPPRPTRRQHLAVVAETAVQAATTPKTH